MKNLLSSLFANKTDASSRNTRLEVEGLEDRLTMSTVQLNAGVIDIYGTDGNNKAVVSLKDNGHTVKVKADGHVYTFSASAVSSIWFEGYYGNDKFTNKTYFSSTAYGGNGKDKLIGGSGYDALHGGYGNDKINGGGGADWLYGDQDNDALYYNLFDYGWYGGSGTNSYHQV